MDTVVEKVGAEKMDGIISRLRKEREEIERGIFEEGKADGLIWAEDAHFTDLQNAVAWDPQMSDLPEHEDLADQIKEMIQEDPNLDYESDRSWRLDEKTTQYFLRWVEGVQEIWNKAKSKVF